MILKGIRMKRLCRGLTVLTLAFGFNSARAADGPPVTPFEADGLVADVLDLFPHAIKDEKTFAARALVTKDGVYAFLETPENQRSLNGVTPGPAVGVKGRLFVVGSLLHIDFLARA